MRATGLRRTHGHLSTSHYNLGFREQQRKTSAKTQSLRHVETINQKLKCTATTKQTTAINEST
jgi:hypothetical protein